MDRRSPVSPPATLDYGAGRDREQKNAAPFLPWTSTLALACLAAIFLMNRDFYALCRRQGGAAFAAGSFLLHWLSFMYATLTFAVVTLVHRIRGPHSASPRA